MNILVHVALKIAHNNGLFTYAARKSSIDEKLWGRRVKVFFRKRLVTGLIIEEISNFEPTEHKFTIKNIEEIIDEEPVITREQFALMNFCATYYLNDLGTCVHLALPRNEKKKYSTKSPKKNTPKKTPAQLSPAQEQAAAHIKAHRSGAFLLEGITGSGKTHVYLDVARETLKEGRSVLFLVPEISLTPQLVQRVQAELDSNTVVMHSNITPAKKRDAIFALLEQKARVLIGARSAIFAPLINLGLIVVDEEHDASFKQEESPRYNARDLALWRGKQEKARVILGSATPSLESSLNALHKRIDHLFLHERFQKDRALPRVEIIDLTKRAQDVDFRTQDKSKSPGASMCILSRPLVIAIRETLAKKSQVLLFLNQRGYARFGVCYNCGLIAQCPNCSVGLTYYQKSLSLLCHQCHHHERAQTTCRQCLNNSIRFVGLGTERLEEEVKMLFPEAKVMRLDRDVVRSQARLEQTLNAMHDHTADILIGTQMVAKGHDFLHVGLVGIVCADVALSMPDFRASEKTFQLLTQVAGRAGRGKHEGRALIQTFNPEHPSIFFAKTHNVAEFISQELALRKRFAQPPFTKAALIRLEHPDESVVQNIISSIHELLRQESTLQILGPVPSPIERVNNRFRYQILALSASRVILHDALNNLKSNKILTQTVNKKQARLIIDVDPQNMS
jgi:primosomal protein N' (replication factor Y)